MKSWNEIGKELVMMITDGVKSGLKKGGQFISTQFPILCKQIITLGIIKHSLAMIFWLIVIGVCIGIAISLLKVLIINDSFSGGGGRGNPKDLLFIPFLAAITGGLGAIFTLYANGVELLKAIFSPMIFIIEFLKNFSKSD